MSLTDRRSIWDQLITRTIQRKQLVLLLPIIPLAGAVIPLLPTRISILFATIYLSVFPGFLLWDIFADGTEGWSISAMNILGLSWAFLMVASVCLIFAGSPLGTSRPIRTEIFVPYSTGVLFVISSVTSYRWYNGHTPWFADLSTPVLNKKVLLYCAAVYLFTIATVLSGAELLRVGFICFLCGIPVLGLNADSSADIKLLAVCFSTAILLYVTFVTTNLTGFDVFRNFAFTSMVIESGQSAFGWSYNYANILTTQSLIPMYHFYVNGSLFLVYQFAIPIVFGTVIPVGLLIIFEDLLEDRWYLLIATLFVVSFSGYILLPNVLKFGIALTFLQLLLINLRQRPSSQSSRKLLLLPVFGIFIVVSHYTAAWLFVIAAGAAFSGKLVLDRLIRRRTKAVYLRPALLTIVGLLSVYYYFQVGGGVLIASLLNNINILEILSQNPATDRAVDAGFAGIGQQGIFVSKVLLYTGISFGLLVTMYRIFTTDVAVPFYEYFLFGGVTLCFIGIQLVGATVLNPRRIVLFSLMFTAPFCIIGLVYIAEHLQLQRQTVVSVVLVFFILSFIFSTGMVTLLVGGEDIRLFDFQPNPSDEDKHASAHLIQESPATAAYYGDHFLDSIIAVGYEKAGVELRRENIVSRKNRILTPAIAEGELTSGEESYIVYHSENTREQAFYLPQVASRQKRSSAWFSIKEQPYKTVLSDSVKVYDSGTVNHYKQ